MSYGIYTQEGINKGIIHITEDESVISLFLAFWHIFGAASFSLMRQPIHFLLIFPDFIRFCRVSIFLHSRLFQPV